MVSLEITLREVYYLDVADRLRYGVGRREIPTTLASRLNDNPWKV